MAKQQPSFSTSDSKELFVSSQVLRVTAERFRAMLHGLKHCHVRNCRIVTTEHKRLEATKEQNIPWKKWGPYLSERQWGTVREDYSENGDAWNFFTHDHARSRAYRWGEDGLAGISDDQQQLCFALALWNGKDAILKERSVWIDQQRRQPRRRREGVLLLPRQHADPLVHEVSVQVSAGRLSLCRPGRDEPRGATADEDGI